jgi:glycosyltransferase involved in cell wall biosynthesis
MKILLLNWRSLKDPLSGGAEQSTFEIAKRWVKNHNAEVTWISAPYNNEVKKEEIEGINFLYLGNKLHRDNTLSMILNFPWFLIATYKFIKSKGNNYFNIVIDQVHGIPFFTPLYIKSKIFVYIHEVAGDIWHKMFIFPISVIGIFIEKFVLTKIYKKIKFITVSQSTKDALLKIGINQKNIKIVEAHGLTMKVLQAPKEKFSEFTVVFLNRLVKMKGPERAISIFSKLKSLLPESKLIIVGRGDEEYVSYLKNIVKELNLEKDVDFKGFVSLEDKTQILQKTHVLLNTSYKEGWGLVNLEANSQGTPAIAFNVEGCRDSIKPGINGYIAEDEEDFVQKILDAKENNLQMSSIEHSRQYNYDDKSEEFWDAINE